VGEVIEAKRQAERTNSVAVASLQRLLGEPASHQRDLQLISALTTYCQRATRALTVLAIGLGKRERFESACFTAIVEKIDDALETLAQAVETGPRAVKIAPISMEAVVTEPA